MAAMCSGVSPLTFLLVVLAWEEVGVAVTRLTLGRVRPGQWYTYYRSTFQRLYTCTRVSLYCVCLSVFVIEIPIYNVCVYIHVYVHTHVQYMGVCVFMYMYMYMNMHV